MLIKKIKEIEPKAQAYRFIMFVDVDQDILDKVTKVAPSEFGDNALMTYCYIDKIEGLRYRFIRCVRQYVNGNVEGRNQHVGELIDFKEGEIRSEAYLMKIFTESGGEPYEDVTDEIKAVYGYYPELCKVNDDILFDTYRHPCNKKRLLGILFNPDVGDEYVWVEEEESFTNHIKAKLLEDPENEDFGVRKGDEVTILAEQKEEGGAWPIIWLKWMEAQGYSLKEMTELKRPMS